MAKPKNTLPTYAFPWEVDTLPIVAEGSETSVNVTITADDCNGEVYTLLSEQFFFDSDGSLVMADLAPMLEDVRNEYDPESYTVMTITLEWTADGTTSTATYEVKVFGCSQRTKTACESFRKSSFLNAASGNYKYVPIDAKEYIYLISPEDQDVTVTAVFRSSDGSAYTISDSLYNSGADASFVGAFDVSPSVMIADLRREDDDELISYKIECGSRYMRYVIRDKAYGEQCIEFYNMFWQKERIYFSEVERSVKPDYSSASFNAQKRNYLIKPNTTFSGTTYPLSEGDEQLFDQFVHARKAWRVSDGAQIILTDADFKPTNGAGELLTGTASWQVAYNQNVFTPPTQVDIFDETFDETYN